MVSTEAVEPSKTDTTPEAKPNTSNNNGSQNNVPKGQVTSNSAQKPTVNVPATSNEQQLPSREPEGEAAADVRITSNQATPTFSNDVQTAIIQEAYRHRGKPYVWGAKGPNAFDCSGLTYAVYANATGHNIGGWTGDQQYAGTQIPVSEAQTGDLLFWGAPTSVTTHVAIYSGNGHYIHTPQPGDVVKIGSISAFTPTFAVRVNIAGLPKATTSLANAFGEYSTNQPFIFNKNQTTDQFIKKIGETSREIGQKNGIYASVMIAQAILESGSGNSSLASAPNYNLFGIKGKYKDQTVTFQTLEQDTLGASFQITSEFRKYPSYKESLEDYAKLIKKGISGNTTFYKAAWKEQTASYKDATKHLQGRYATDKQYAEKLNAIIKTYKLTTFDQGKKTTITTTDSKVKDPQTSFKTKDDLQSKLIAISMNDPRVPHTMSTVQFVNLFRGDSLIALAMTALPTSGTPNNSLLTASSIYVPLNNGLLAIIPPK
ncbi:glucosaminidase domain-containing protein [Enterococcus sp. AZ196]|uniref:C40 family peptidase n=1 Tax=Enterococcus sp. AZ196 TaxID=2774659 RepID=UPI003D2DD893